MERATSSLNRWGDGGPKRSLVLCQVQSSGKKPSFLVYPATTFHLAHSVGVRMTKSELFSRQHVNSPL